MGNIIKIKRGNGAPTKDSLQDGEFGFDKTSEILYIGKENNGGRRKLVGFPSIEYVNEGSAPEFRESKEDIIIKAEVVSSVEHDVECKVERINVLSEKIESFKNEKTVMFSEPVIKPWLYIENMAFDSEISRCYVSYLNQSGQTINGNSFSLSELPLNYNVYVTGDEPVYGIKITAYPGETNVNFTFNNVMVSADKQSNYYSPVPDLSAVTVSRYGKNLVLFEDTNPAFGKTIVGLTNLLNTFPADTSVTISFDVKVLSDLPVGNDYFYGIVFFNSAGTFTRIFGWGNAKNGDIKEYTTTLKITNEYAGKFTDNGLYACGEWATGKTSDVELTDFQVEIGDAKTPYAPVIKTDYTPNADGIVTGMKSLSPNMTILTDNPGVLLMVIYNVDTASYIAKHDQPLSVEQVQSYSQIQADRFLKSTEGVFSKKDGTNAAGTWGIDITGEAGSVDWSGIKNVPQIPYTQLKRYHDSVSGHHKLRIYCQNLVAGRKYQVQLFTQRRHGGHQANAWHHPANSFVVGSKETPKGYAILLKANPYDDSTIPPTQRPPVPDWMLNGGILKSEWDFIAESSFYVLELDINDWLLDMTKNWNDINAPQLIGITETRDATGCLKFRFKIKDLENGILGTSEDTYRIGSVNLSMTNPNNPTMSILYSSIY